MQLTMTAEATGSYQLRRLLGEGGFGRVYEAWDETLRRSVAIKRLKPQVAATCPHTLLEEARLAASLSHAAFVKVFSVDGDADQQSIVMEYVDGLTLRQSLQSGPLAEHIALDIVAQVADGMRQAHDAQLVHGDIKPSNLMLEPSGTVRIMDFGLARRIDLLATASLAGDLTEGTVAYLAPELLRGARHSKQSDIYALGVVLYEMINGATPFPHLRGLSLATAQLQSSAAQWPFAPGVTPAVAALVCAMTARDLERRTPTMAAVREAALAILQAPPAAAPVRPVAASRLAGWARRLRWRHAGGAAAIGLTLVGGVAALARYGDSERVQQMFVSDAGAMRSAMAALANFDREGGLETAVQGFSALLARSPDHAGAAAGLALAYAIRYAGDGRDESLLQRADASAQLALKLDDQLALAYAAQASVRELQGRRQEALQLEEAALRLDPRNLHALYGSADILVRAQRFDEAERAIDAAASLYPRERLFSDLRGVLRYRQGDYAGAERAFRHSIALQPDAVFAYANLNAALLRQGRVEEALQVLQDGLQIRPNGQLYTNLGNALFNRGDYLGAAHAFEQALAKGNRATYLRWANLADTLRWIPGRERESREAYREATALLSPLLERRPHDPTMLSRMGLYTARLGDSRQAISFTRGALAQAPKNAELRFRAAIAFELGGDRSAAVAELETARKLGYPANLISAEPDLSALRRDSRYHSTLPESTR